METLLFTIILIVLAVALWRMRSGKSQSRIQEIEKMARSTTEKVVKDKNE